MKVKRSKAFAVPMLALIVGLLVSCFFVSGSSLWAEAPVPADSADKATNPVKDISETIDKLVKIVETHPGPTNSGVRRKEMRDVIAPRFDFEEMAKRSLGTSWNAVTEDERNQFISVFSDLLAKTYLNRIESIERGMVTMNGEKVEFPKALVKTMVSYKGDLFPLDYRLVHRGGKWKVYDVIIENIGLVANYRNEFAGIIRKEKFDGLLKRLRAKVAA